VLVLGLSMLVGAALIVGSVPAHVNSAIFDGKRLGYWSEVNWSVNYVMSIPFALYFCAATMNCIRHVVYSLSNHGMVVSENGTSIDKNALLNSWHLIAGKALRVALVLGALALLVSLIEWYSNFFYGAHPIIWPADPNGLLPGWNLAPVVNGTGWLQAALFGFVAYTCQGLTAAAFFAFVCMIMGFAIWIYSYTSDQTAWELIPDLKSSDTRRGFELFEPFVENLLWAAFFFFTVFFLMRIDNAYVQIPSFKSLTDFLYQYIWTADLFKDKSGLRPGTIPDDIRYPFVMAGTALAVTLGMVFSVPSLILRTAASACRARADENFDALSLAMHFAEDATVLRARLATMTFWPLKYPAPAQLILVIILAAACYVWFQITLALVAVLVYRAVKELLKVINSGAGAT
jgi:hypothetical protein